MAAMWRKMAEYLGLAPDEEFDDYEEAHEPQAPPARPAAGRAPAVRDSTVTPMPQRIQPAPVSPVPVEEVAGVASVRPLHVPPPDSGTVTARPMVRPAVPAFARPNVVTAERFSDAQAIADRFKSHQPVIMNLQGLDRDLSRRLIDFASGLCYGLSGHMEKVATQVFLLTPADVEIPAEERRRLQEHGLVDS